MQFLARLLKMKNVILPALVLIIFGVVLMVMSGAMAKDEKKRETFIQTDATIMSIETWRDSDGDIQGEVKVEYTVDGVAYEAIIGYSSDMKEGQIVDIYYNPADPAESLTETSHLFIWLLRGIGIFLFVLVIPVTLKNLRRLS